ncbi:hypothetical protein MRB53_028314 [Persea americana]|uniref:Uncharacterized protein n=1 Tax=Persea americana TaxID=3435 RepID=A0ACC2KF64_PERAE|nr:hypothetical protein MRB53_028314 [Persea americana]
MGLPGYRQFNKQAKYRYRTLFGWLALCLCFLVAVQPYMAFFAGTAGRKGIFESKQICDVSDPRSDFCTMKGEIRIHGHSSEIFLLSSSQKGLLPENATWKIRPYARKGNNAAMGNVRELSLKSLLTAREQAPNCSAYHEVPALVFSIGGFTGNYFHDFTDILVPLFVTSRQFHGEVQFLITDKKSWWIDKYRPILKHLSKYEIIDFDTDDRVHCFFNMLVGLRSHKELSIDPSRCPNGYSMHDFIKFLRSIFSLERDFVVKITDDVGKKPRLLIISRRSTRTFTNVGEIEAMATSLGYEVVVSEADSGMPLSKISRFINSFDVMMGVHGAGLTNLVFLPTNAVLIQVVPFGNMDWIARTDFEEPSGDMKLRYLKYKIGENESSLTQQFPHDHGVLRDPYSIDNQGWSTFSSIYLEKQNVTLDVGRFKGTLLKALELLHK